MNIKALITSIAISLLSFSLIVQATSITGSFTITHPGVPLTPKLIEAPDNVSCVTFITQTGRAEKNVDIYVNDVYKVTSNSSDGYFELILPIVQGENIFSIKAYDSDLDEYSNASSYSITASSNCGVQASSRYTSSKNVKKTQPVLPIKEAIKIVESIEKDDLIVEEFRLNYDLEPISNIQEQNDTSEDERTGRRVVPDVVNIYDDLDEDGVSDYIEVVLELDSTNPDTDNDGIKDVYEISTIKSEVEGDPVQSNMYDGLTFSCDNFTIVGKTEQYDTRLSFCLEGANNNDKCIDIEVNDDSFIAQFNHTLKRGDYKAQFWHDEELIEEYDVSCVESSKIKNVSIESLDFLNVYKNVRKNIERRQRLYAFRTQPAVSGFGDQYDLVFGYWIKNGKVMYESIAFTDIDGKYVMKPHDEIDTHFGVGKAELMVFNNTDGLLSSSDIISFYVFDIKILLLEALFLMFLLYKLVRYRRKRR